MRIRFNGMFGVKHLKSGGCGCGGTSVSGKVFLTHKTLALPSGTVRTFTAGEEYEVNDLDGNFLLSYSHVDKDGLRQDSFTRID